MKEGKFETEEEIRDELEMVLALETCKKTFDKISEDRLRKREQFLLKKLETFINIEG